MRLLDRYLLKNSFVPFLLCFFGFLAIWLVFDLKSNAPTFIDGHVHLRFVLYYYATQLPQIAVIALPFGLLLAVLFAMTKMSRSNEIIAMLTAGQSLPRLLLPLILAGMVITGASTALNYKLAPRADSARKKLLSTLGKKQFSDIYLSSQLFRNRSEFRTWFVQVMAIDTEGSPLMRGIHITQQDKDGNIIAKWYAAAAIYTPETKVWRLTHGKSMQFDAAGNATSEKRWPALELTDWSETPWRIASSNMSAQNLSVKDLHTYLHNNADFPDAQLAPYRTHLLYRWALPWQCLVAVLLAAPLGIVYSRRGVLSGVATAIFSFSGMTFLGFLMLALGKGGRISAFSAAWSPILVFAAVGVYCIHLRSTNREAPKISRLFGFR